MVFKKLKGISLLVLILLILFSCSQICHAQVEIELEKGFTVFNVEIVNVDATDPASTQVNYRVIPDELLLESVTFTAPGTTQTATNVSGNFYFTFDQNNLVIGENLITLSVGAYLCNLIVTRLEIRGPQVNEVALAKIAIQEGPVIVFPTISVVHQLFEIYHLIDYSCPVVEGSKVIWIGKSSVNIQTQQSELPTAINVWNEKHLYRDNDGDHLEQLMIDVTYPTLPPQTDYFKSKDSSNDTFFKRNNNLKGIGCIESLAFSSPAGPVFAFIILNQEIDKAIE